MKSSAEYWDDVADRWSIDSPQRLWRHYCDRLNAELLREYLADSRVERALKTDLFDEAVSESGVVESLEQMANEVVGIDLSLLTGRIADHRFSDLHVCSADARTLPFADGCFDLVVSNSTLDHFEQRQHIGTALAEMNRVLRPGGRLLLTLDNLANPAIALRSVLPQRILSGLRLVPYYVGATCGPRRLRHMVGEAGLRLIRDGANMHCPRLPAVAAANLLDRNGRSERRDGFVEFLLRWESLERLPTRYLTGYFIVMLAERPKL